MLVLTRTTEEKLIIGEGANKTTITVVDVQGSKVRLGIDAPKHISIYREEVLAQRNTAQSTQHNAHKAHQNAARTHEPICVE